MPGHITIIISIYNQSEAISTCVLSLKRQSYSFKDMEIILINDGSEDKSDKICSALSGKYSNIKYYSCEHHGVSAARNVGIRAASGKYIFYLDVDDRLSKNTIRDCVSTFDSMYNQVDLLTYPIETYYRGRKLEPHFRGNGLFFDSDIIQKKFYNVNTFNLIQ